MHRLASTLVSFFLSPFTWVVLFLIAGFFLPKRSWRRKCRIGAVVLFFLFGNQALLDVFADWWQPLPVSASNKTVYSCGIVPGGFGSPGRNGEGYFNSTADRFIQVEKLYKVGEIKHILINGGNGKEDDEDFREGYWAKGELITMGIPDSVIFVEDRSTSTADNARNAKQILDSLQLKPPFLLVTSAFHVPRASLLFRKAGVPNVPFPCNYFAGRGKFNWSFLVPKLSVLLTWELLLKEYAGYAWYRFTSR